MRCVVTAGPTYEPLDKVRRLTNFSTGRLGCELAGFLTERGHEVLLLIGEMATYRTGSQVGRTEMFTTTSNLKERLQAASRDNMDAVFHAAAVSDFGFGKILARSPKGELVPLEQSSCALPVKISTRQGALLAELVPTPKIIAELRTWFPEARLVGWKYEVNGDQASVVQLAREQIDECLTNACVANGPAYGLGFGLVNSDGTCAHFRDKTDLFAALEKLTD